MAEGLKIVNALHRKVVDAMCVPPASDTHVTHVAVDSGLVYRALAVALLTLLDDKSLAKQLVEYLRSD